MTCLTAMLVLGSYALRDEWRIMRVMQAQADQSAGLSSDNLTAQLAADATGAAALPARGAMARAIVRLRAAARIAAPARKRQFIAAGFADAVRANEALPHSGQAALTLAYAHVMRDGPASPMALTHFARSYAIHPYLHDGAEWRLRYAVQNWTRLHGAIRTAVAREGRWFMALRASNRLHVYVLTGGSPVWAAIAGDKPPFPHSHTDRF